MSYALERRLLKRQERSKRRQHDAQIKAECVLGGFGLGIVLIVAQVYFPSDTVATSHECPTCSCAQEPQP